MDYANSLEAIEPAHARSLKAELHKRATQLSLDAVQDNAEMVLDGTNQSQEGSLELVEQLKTFSLMQRITQRPPQLLTSLQERCRQASLVLRPHHLQLASKASALQSAQTLRWKKGRHHRATCKGLRGPGQGRGDTMGQKRDL